MNSTGTDTAHGTRRDAIMAAAVTVLAQRGPRGFTHRAVDAAAGLSPGSVNHHAPSRQKLLSLALEEVLRRDMDILARYLLVPEWTRNSAADAITGFVMEMADEPHRQRVIARHHLLTEATTDPELRAALDHQHALFVAVVIDTYATAGQTVSVAEAELIRMSIDAMLFRQTMIGPTPLTVEQVLEMVGIVIKR